MSTPLTTPAPAQGGSADPIINMIHKIRRPSQKAPNAPPARSDNYKALAQDLLRKTVAQKRISFLLFVLAIFIHLNFFYYLLGLKNHSVATFGAATALLIVSLVAVFVLSMQWLEKTVSKITLARFFLILDSKNMSWQEACTTWPEDALRLLSHQSAPAKKSSTHLFAPLLAHTEKSVRLKTIQAISLKPPSLLAQILSIWPFPIKSPSPLA